MNTQTDLSYKVFPTHVALFANTKKGHMLYNQIHHQNNGLPLTQKDLPHLIEQIENSRFTISVEPDNVMTDKEIDNLLLELTQC